MLKSSDGTAASRCSSREPLISSTARLAILSWRESSDEDHAAKAPTSCWHLWAQASRHRGGCRPVSSSPQQNTPSVARSSKKLLRDFTVRRRARGLRDAFDALLRAQWLLVCCEHCRGSRPKRRVDELCATMLVPPFSLSLCADILACPSRVLQRTSGCGDAKTCRTRIARGRLFSLDQRHLRSQPAHNYVNITPIVW